MSGIMLPAPHGGSLLTLSNTNPTLSNSSSNDHEHGIRNGEERGMSNGKSNGACVHGDKHAGYEICVGSESGDEW